VENVFASLVVLLGYTHTFTRRRQWQKHARYVMGDDLVCGFRQETERDGELDFVLCFGPNVGGAVRKLFQAQFESFLARHDLTVTRYEPVPCTRLGCGHVLDRSVVRTLSGKEFVFCNKCGERLTVPKMDEPIQLTRDEQTEVATGIAAATQRKRFEQAIFRVQTYVGDQKIRVPECFISYAWGEPQHERWVEKSLAMDLQKAGIGVVLDQWEKRRAGASVPRFVDRIGKCSHVIVVGTPLYLQKWDNKDPNRGYVVSLEIQMLIRRMYGTQAERDSVVPVLLAGDEANSFPEALRILEHADFRKEADYFVRAFDLILTLYGIAPNDPAVADLRDSLEELQMRQGIATE
jgi:hypothetical protein